MSLSVDPPRREMPSASPPLPSRVEDAAPSGEHAPEDRSPAADSLRISQEDLRPSRVQIVVFSVFPFLLGCLAASGPLFLLVRYLESR